MRNPDGTLRGDLDDNIPALVSGSIVTYASSSLDENLTEYDLLSVPINKPPFILQPVTVSSGIRPYVLADGKSSRPFIFSDGTIKIHIGADFVLSIQASQPNIYNVENGILKIIPSTVGLTYTWRRDGEIISSYELPSLQSSVIVSGSTLTFKNMQPSYLGSYTCDVTNDIGTVTSEPITIEIQNTSFDSYFYQNLVKNPYGKDSTNDWESNNLEFISKPLSNQPTVDFIKPYNVDKFDYTVDMFNPRPYQIDPGYIKGFDMTKDLLNNGYYFTRDKYKYITRGGSFLVRAYQDIDLTEIEPFIRGGVYGVDGVRAIFSCYIGNALSKFYPTLDRGAGRKDGLVEPSNRTSPKFYSQGNSRISVENFLKAGPSFGPDEIVYVTLEEFDNETRLPSSILSPDGVGGVVTYDRIRLNDAWTNTISKHTNKVYYTQDIYGIGELSPGDGRDAVLYAADELLKDENTRFAYGQYVSFNKIILDQLNPNTTKVRITMHFQTDNPTLFDNEVYYTEVTEEPLPFSSWEKCYDVNTFKQSSPITGEDSADIFIQPRISRKSYNKDKSLLEVLPLAGVPRGMATGFNFSLLPVFTRRPGTTAYYTANTLTLNDTPASIVPSGLNPNARVYDPKGVQVTEQFLRFRFQLNTSASALPNGEITQNGLLSINLYREFPNPAAVGAAEQNLQQGSITYVPQPYSTQSLFNFVQGQDLLAEAAPQPITYSTSGSSQRADEVDNTKKYLAYRFTAAVDQTKNEYRNAGNTLVTKYNWTIAGKLRVPSEDNDTEVIWNNKARYQLKFALPESSEGLYWKFAENGASGSVSKPNSTNTNLGRYTIQSSSLVSTIQAVGGTIQTVFVSQSSNISRDLYLTLQDYIVTLDFSNPTGSTVTLSRDADLFPGSGSISLNLPHTVTPFGLLCTVPMSFMNKPYREGGMGYRRPEKPDVTDPFPQPYYDYDIVVAGSVLSCIESLRKNLAPYKKWSLPLTAGLYNRLLQQILAPVNNDINTLPPSDAPFPASELKAFVNDLLIYATNLNSNFDSSKYPEELAYYSETSYTINLTDGAFTGRDSQNQVQAVEFTRPPAYITLAEAQIAEPRKPSLYGIKSVDPSYKNENIGSPAYGVSSTGQRIKMIYLPVRDSYTLARPFQP